MDYLTFGLLAGSLTVIASFAVRDAAPHLSSIGDGSRLGRLGRRDAPTAWTRWCADVGLVLAAAGTLVLLVTVGALLLGVSDGTGSLLVAVGVVAAAAGSAIAIARLSRRYGHERDAERGEQASIPSARADSPRTAAAVSPRSTRSSADEPVGSPDLWDDDLPIWAPATTSDAPPAATASAAPDSPVTNPAEAPGRRSKQRARSEAPAAPPPPAPEDRRPVSGRLPNLPSETAPVSATRSAEPNPLAIEPEPPVLGGSFSSPLLAGIGPDGLVDEPADRFRSPLLSNLDEPSTIEPSGPSAGADLLIDEAPAPVHPTARSRDEIDSR